MAWYDQVAEIIKCGGDRKSKMKAQQEMAAGRAKFLCFPTLKEENISTVYGFLEGACVD